MNPSKDFEQILKTYTLLKIYKKYENLRRENLIYQENSKIEKLCDLFLNCSNSFKIFGITKT